MIAESFPRGPIPWLRLTDWEERYGVVAGLTLKRHPEMPEAEPFGLGLWGEEPAGVVSARWRALRAALPEFPALRMGHQVHGTVIRVHADDPPVPGWSVEEGIDGHVATRAGIGVLVTVADCIPVYLVDPVARIVALLHAGWRGVAGGILACGVGAMATRGARPERIAMHCGVGICRGCYEVGAEVLAACGKGGGGAAKGYVDLRQVLGDQGRGLGLQRISSSPHCSREGSDRFFSHRAHEEASGRMVAFLGYPRSREGFDFITDRP